MELEKLLLTLVSIFTSTLIGAVIFLFKRQDFIRTNLGVQESLLNKLAEEMKGLSSLHESSIESDKQVVSLSEKNKFLAKKVDTKAQELDDTKKLLRESLNDLNNKLVTEKRVIALLTEHLSVALAPFRKQLENSEQNRRESTVSIDKKLDKLFEILDPISKKVAQQEIINQSTDEKIKRLDSDIRP